MSRIFGPLLVVIAVVGGYLWYRNQGESKTVTTPSAPGVGGVMHGAESVGASGVHTGDTWVQAHAVGLGTALAFVVVGALLWAIWSKLGKGWLVLLVVVGLVLTGFLRVTR